MLAVKSVKRKMIIGQRQRLNISDCQLISSGQVSVELSEESKDNMLASYHFLRDAVDKRIPIYGVNTQFGDQVTLIDPELNNDSESYYRSIEERQKNLIKSHCCSLGERTPKEMVRVAMALRAHCLSQGYSGIKPDTVQAILAVLNAGITPLVNRYGSIGASGDLIPLASIATAVIGGDTKVDYQDTIMPALTALRAAGLKPLIPEMRDGLAMINGTSFMSAIASLALYDLDKLFKNMLTTIAMSLESMLVIQSAYHPLVHQVKGQLGEMEVNDYLLSCWEGSSLLTDLDELRIKTTDQDLGARRAVQDVYSLRSIAQGFGPFADNLKRAIEWVEIEINSVNDNPIIDIENGKIHHGANFMGYYVTDACDIMKMNIAQASTWLHAILANMVHPRKNQGLPTSLVANVEKFNGFRPLQLLAASLAVQNRKLAQSHQAYMLPTEGDNQDVNSLGTHAAFDLQESVRNLERLTGILLLASVQALEFRGIHKASTKAKAIHKKIRKYHDPISECRPLTETLEEVISFMRNEGLAS
jgi:histidine ammonia-lyase